MGGALVRRIDAVNRAHPWSHNDHYVPWVLRQVPPGAASALDVGRATDVLAVPANLVVGLLSRRRAAAARVAMSAPAAPARETLREVRAAAPAATVRRRLFWRYTLVEDAPR